MTMTYRLGRSLAVAIVALLLIVGAAFASGATFQPTAVSTTIGEPETTIDEGDQNNVEDQAGNVDEGDQNNVEDGNQDDANQDD